MQPRAFEPLALEWGLDVLKLQRAFQCSYAAVTIRGWPRCCASRP